MEFKREEFEVEPALVDGGHTIIKCSACEMELVDILHTDPNLEVEMNIKATCPCGDFSFPQVIKGGFHYSVPMRTEGEVEFTDVGFGDIIQDNENNMIIFVVIKTGGKK